MQDEQPPHQVASGTAQALVAAVDAVEDAEKALDQRVRVELGVNNTDFAVLQYPSDARVRRLALTDDASRRLQEIVGAVRADLDALLDTIPQHEEARLIELLGQVRDIFQSGSAAR
jgi:Na+/phosphate symporter